VNFDFEILYRRLHMPNIFIYSGWGRSFEAIGVSDDTISSIRVFISICWWSFVANRLNIRSRSGTRNFQDNVSTSSQLLSIWGFFPSPFPPRLQNFATHLPNF
jgi:hypothetical protein